MSAQFNLFVLVVSNSFLVILLVALTKYLVGICASRMNELSPVSRMTARVEEVYRHF
ncbi:MAG: hypothetical protein ACK2T3_00290 [Candidatus Promineifilaceae bacterium]|jgi:hypothetical protein